MELKEHIIEIQKDIKTGQFSTEAAVSRGIVMRILESLKWPIYKTKVVWPEYPLETRYVDYALCHPPEKPVVIIEVKNIGKLRDADTQLFEYAFHAGVPMAVLTDGQEWNFYLPSGKGSYDERRFYKIDLLERKIEEIVNSFTRYLSFYKVCSGNSIKAAHDDYENVTKEREGNEYLPKAWRKLIEEQDSTLIDLVSEEVADLCGYKPAPDTVAKFLTQLSVIGQNPPNPPPIINYGFELKGQKPPNPYPVINYGFELKGQKYTANSAIDVLIKIIEKLSSLDSTFLTRFASRKHGRSRRYIAQNRDELYPGRKDFTHMSSQLSSGWFIGKNYAPVTIEKIIKMACEVAGISYGHDLIVFLGK